MKRIVNLMLAFFAVLALMGCCSSHIVPEPGKITLQEALKSVGEGLYEMKEAQKNLKTGLVPSEVTVTFNVTASATDTGKLYVELSSIPVAGGAAKVGGETSSKVEAARGHQITVKFNNLLMIEKDKLACSMEPKKIQELFDTLQKLGVQVYLVPDRKPLE